MYRRLVILGVQQPLQGVTYLPQEVARIKSKHITHFQVESQTIYQVLGDGWVLQPMAIATLLLVSVCEFLKE